MRWVFVVDVVVLGVNLTIIAFNLWLLSRIRKLRQFYVRLITDVQAVDRLMSLRIVQNMEGHNEPEPN